MGCRSTPTPEPGYWQTVLLGRLAEDVSLNPEFKEYTCVAFKSDTLKFIP